MSAIAANTARPPKAAIAWVQDDRLFVELPTKTGVPYVCSYKRTLEGLTAALNILIENSDALAPVARPSVAQAHPAVRKVASFNEDQREVARGILKKMGIT
jgi:hypothetical protein